MARIARKNLYEESQFFHVLVQGIAQSYLFEHDMFKGFYLKCLNEQCEDKKVSILAFCIMDNHAHFLLYSDDARQITKVMRNVNTKYAQFYNRNLDRVGYVFRDRFKSEPIMKGSHLFNCVNYIHNNPVKAKIVVTQEEYDYSSARNYVTRSGIIDVDVIDEVIGCTNIKNYMYEGFLEEKQRQSKEIENIIDDALKSLNKDDIKQIKTYEEIKKLVNYIQKNAEVSLRRIAELTGISKDKINRAMKKS